MKEIPLTRGMVAIVDDDDYGLLSQWKWHCTNFGYADRKIYWLVDGVRHSRHLPMHRVIMNAPDDLFVDHINGDKLDNRKCNLRFATPQQNMANRKGRKNTSSKYKGVAFDKQTQKWRAALYLPGRFLGLGRFDSEIDAALAYDCAAIEHHGEYAMTNKKLGLL